jgi:CheY-like chemotaxis protein
MLEKPYFDGLVLICDDNSMNQEVISAHLGRVGVKTLIAENGKIGVEMVLERKQKNAPPFDLIFMDMFMPVMDGMEATSKIMALNTGTPIVAMTANVMTSELEKYKKHGMPDCLGKPFTSQELWRVLLKYLVPVGAMPANIDPINGFEDNKELLKKLQISFIKNNKTTHTEISEAISAGDIKLAHRLAHTLKGNAGMIGKTRLRNAAAEVEELLKDNLDSEEFHSLDHFKMVRLSTDDIEIELMLVLDELKPLLDEFEGRETTKALNREQVLALFDKLEPMLININPESVGLLDDIRSIPGAEVLAQQIEEYDFESASRTLVSFKKEWEKKNE